MEETLELANIPDNGLHDLVEAIGKLGVHDHLCLIYETQAEQFAAVIPYMKLGLERGEKCLYVVDDNTAATVINSMKAAGIEVESAIEAGKLIIVSKQEAYLKRGYFDPDWMIDFLQRATDEAKATGFSALRITGEMTWTLGGDPGVERLMEYEAKLNYFFPQNDALAICQYNRHRFSPELLKDVIATHPLVICGGLVCRNLYYVPPDEFLGEDRSAREIERLLANIINREKVEGELRRYQAHLEELVKARTAELEAKIIERQRAEDEIRRLNQELEQRVLDRTAQLEASIKELEAFTYSVSHNLRAPVRHIDGFLELLQQRLTPTLDAQSQHYMQTIASSARHMGLLIDDLLSFSRMGRHELSRQSVDLNGLVREIIREFEPEARGRDIHWRVADLPVVTGDHAMLRMVLVNLISNALKFTRSREPVEIEIGSTCQDNEAVFWVRDNGVGFDPKYADKLFGVFQRLHPAEEFEGTGIGLANVRRIINRHGGRTWAQGEVDHGATFYFSLPTLDRGV